MYLGWHDPGGRNKDTTQTHLAFIFNVLKQDLKRRINRKYEVLKLTF